MASQGLSSNDEVKLNGDVQTETPEEIVDGVKSSKKLDFMTAWFIGFWFDSGFVVCTGTKGKRREVKVTRLTRHY